MAEGLIGFGTREFLKELSKRGIFAQNPHLQNVLGIYSSVGIANEETILPLIENRKD